MKQAPRHHETILQAAIEMGCKVEPAPEEWTGSAFNAEVLGATPTRRSVPRDTRDLPELIGAARVDDMPLLIGEIKGPPDLAIVEEQMRRYRNQAMVARSWMGSEGPNLQLFLIGPAGAFDNAVWRERAAQIEADDRVCRKLVWMCPTAPNLSGALEFLGRTFLARPWPEHGERAMDLDQLEIGLPAGWSAAVDDENLDAEAVVLEIVRLEGEAE